MAATAAFWRAVPGTHGQRRTGVVHCPAPSTAPERRLAELKIRHCGLGTSGSGQQFFYHRGHRYGHVLDPRSGAPAEGVLSATVLAPDAAEADALATAFFVLGVDATRAYCETRPELAVVFVLPGTREGTVALETIGIEEQLLVLDEGSLGGASSAGRTRN